MLDGGSILRRGGLFLGGDGEIVNQADPIAGRHGRDLVLAVGIERGVLRFELGIVAAEVDLLGLAVVLDDQRPTFVARRQAHDQGGEHARRLLAVAVRCEEAALFVHK